ncbi:unnamed protein product [Adineta steineri]|uniref:Uncharacterized protein n=1 Tax=Adineta steineri TaxID=433720 RepID=A0A815JP41_9BILA|nr:unnamed protein product [Adineta steineri]CAF1607413.1 unnamed protein product [Adineta steineri]
MEDMTVVWLTENVHFVPEMYVLIVQIRKIVCHLELFDDIADFKNYLESTVPRTLFVIISGALCDRVSDFIDDLSEIQFIYMLTTENRIRYHLSWTTSYSNVRGVFINTDLLLSKIGQDVNNWMENNNSHDTFDFITENAIMSTRDIHAKQIQFKYLRLLLDVLRQTAPPAHSAKDRTMHYCKAANADNELNADQEDHSKSATEFLTNYTAEKAIDWYADESFLKRLLHKILSTDNIDALLDFGFCIVDLDSQLKKLNAQQSQNETETNFHVYCGQYINPMDLKTLHMNVGGFISISTFFSTTMDRQKALKIIERVFQQPLFETVLFDIRIDTYNSESSNFARITRKSGYKNDNAQQEILFTLGTLFRINSILPPNNDLYNQLCKAHTDFDRSTLHSQLFTVYRGQQMSMMELNKLKRNISGYIVVKTFFSATKSSEMALTFAGYGGQRPQFESVLFVIDINSSDRVSTIQKPFGSIGHLSNIPDEDEFLFPMGTIFRLNAVKVLSQSTWMIHLTLYNGENKDINELDKYRTLILKLAKDRQISFIRKKR